MVFGLTIILFFFFLRNSRMVFSQYIDTGQIIRILDEFFPKEEPEKKPELVEVHTLNIPASFFEKGRSKYWLEVEYDPEKTELVRGELGNYLEAACITVRSWKCHIDEADWPRVMPAPNGWIYFQELTNPAIYDGLNGATNLINPVVIKTENWVGAGFKRILEYKSKNITTGKTETRDELIKSASELSFCFNSIHYRIMEQGQALIKVYSKDDATSLYLNPVVVKIDQWVDYRKINRVRDSAGNYSYYLVRKKPLPEYGAIGEIVGAEGAETICDSGPDWFKASLVDMANTEPDTFKKVSKINIFSGLSPNGLISETKRTEMTFFIAQPEEVARMLRLNLMVPKDIFNYQHNYGRTAAMGHESTHIDQQWALKNKEQSGFKDDDNDSLPASTPSTGNWGWQIDSSQINGFQGNLKVDVATIRKEAITKSIAITPSDKNDWPYFKNIILSNVPKEPIVGRGKVPNGTVDSKYVIVTFYWPQIFSLSLAEKDDLARRLSLVSFGPNSITFDVVTSWDYSSNLIPNLGKIFAATNFLEIKYRIITPHHPEEYDADEAARGLYIGR